MKLPDPQCLAIRPGFLSLDRACPPKDHSTAGKTQLGVITRAGDENH
jgi:hypothetical protein